MFSAVTVGSACERWRRLNCGETEVYRDSQQARFTGTEELIPSVHTLETEPNIGSHLFPCQQLSVKLFNKVCVQFLSKDEYRKERIAILWQPLHYLNARSLCIELII